MNNRNSLSVNSLREYRNTLTTSSVTGKPYNVTGIYGSSGNNRVQFSDINIVNEHLNTPLEIKGSSIYVLNPPQERLLTLC